MRCLAVTSAAPTSLASSVWRATDRRGHTWQLPLIYLASRSVRVQRSGGTHHCSGGQISEAFWCICTESSAENTHLSSCFPFFFPPKVYLISHTSDGRSISSSLHRVRPTFVSHHRVIANPVLLACGSHYRVTHNMEGFHQEMAQNCFFLEDQLPNLQQSRSFFQISLIGDRFELGHTPAPSVPGTTSGL